jgi:hypothetical protein
VATFRNAVLGLLVGGLMPARDAVGGQLDTQFYFSYGVGPVGSPPTMMNVGGHRDSSAPVSVPSSLV